MKLLFLYVKSIFSTFYIFFCPFCKVRQILQKKHDILDKKWRNKKLKNKQKMYEFKGEEKMNYLNEVKKANKYKSTL